MAQKINTSASLMVFNDETKIHFHARQRDAYGLYRELAVSERFGLFYFCTAEGSEAEPEFEEEEFATLHQAYACLIRNLNVPL